MKLIFLACATLLSGCAQMLPELIQVVDQAVIQEAMIIQDDFPPKKGSV